MLRSLIFILVISFCLSSCAAKKTEHSKDYYLYAYFTYVTPGLRIALSRDGYRWRHLEKFDGVFNPAAMGLGKFLDCPSILQGPDGYFHMVWSTGTVEFGYAKSRDLIEWEDVRLINPEGGELRDPMTVWAPELFWDPKSKKFVITFTASTKKVPGLKNRHKGNHKAFSVLTMDFKKFTKAKKLLNPDPDIFLIDPYIVHHEGTYYTYLKVEAHNTVDGEKDGIHYTTSPTLFGPHRRLSHTLDRATIDAEGPTVVRLSDHWLMYWDTGHGRRGALASKNLKIWFDVTDRVKFPKDYRHGTAVRIPEETYLNLKRKFD